MSTHCYQLVHTKNGIVSTRVPSFSVVTKKQFQQVFCDFSYISVATQSAGPGSKTRHTGKKNSARSNKTQNRKSFGAQGFINDRTSRVRMLQSHLNLDKNKLDSKHVVLMK